MGDLSANPVAIGTTQRPHISSRPRLDNLTTIRFFAAIHVVFAHFLGPVFTSMPVLAKAVSLGYYAVSIFYVLSGFVLLYGYSDRTGKLRGTKTGFWIGRFSRIYPAYFLAFLLSIPGVIGFIRQNSSWAPKAAKASVAAGSYLLMFKRGFHAYLFGGTFLGGPFPSRRSSTCAFRSSS